MSPSRFATVAGHELRTQLRSPLFWTLLIVLLLVTTTVNPVAMVPAGDVAVEGVRAFVDSPHALAQSFALGGFFAYPFLVALMAGLVLVREEEARVGDLLHSTPLTPGEYVLGKLTGVGAAVGIALGVHAVLVAVVHGTGGWGGGSPVHGGLRPGQLALQALVFAAPGPAFTAVAAFAVGAETRRPLAVYAVPTVLFTLVVTFLWTWAPGAGAWGSRLDLLLKVLDPTGLRWLGRTAFAVDAGNAHFNTAPVPFDAVLLLNRLGVLAACVLLAWISVRRFRPVRDGGAGRRTAHRTAPAGLRGDASGDAPGGERPAGRAAPGAVQPLRDLAMGQRPPGTWAAATILLRCEVGAMRRQPALYLFLPFLALVVAEAAATGPNLYGTPTLLTAGTLAVRTLPVVTLLGCLFLLFTTVESLHREGASGFDALLHSAPLSDGAILLGKGLAGGVLIGLLSLTCIATGLALLLVRDAARVEVVPLLLVFGAVLVPTLLLWTAFVTAAGAVVRHRQATLALGLVALVLTGFWYARGSMTWVTNWPLWSALRWSDLGLFPLHGRALLLNRLAALAGAVFLFAVAHRSFPRVEGDGTRRPRSARVAAGALRLAPFALLPLLVTGFLAIEVRTGFQGEVVAEERRQYHLRHATTWRGVTPPEITQVDLRLDLEPAARRMEVEGHYRVVNRTGRPMRWLPFTVTPSLEGIRWWLDGAPAEVHGSAGLAILEPAVPLPPGGGATVGFSYGMTYPRGLSRNGGAVESFILPSGVLLSTHRGEMLPRPGFVGGPGTAGGDQLRPARFPDGSVPPREGSLAGRTPSFVSRMEVRVPAGDTVSATGDRLAAWSAGGRTTTVWRSDVPVHTLSLHAGLWEARRRDGAAVLFHPGHGRNADLLLDALAAARHHYSEWFFPYPWDELRLGEYPDLHTHATAFPTHVAFPETVGFLAGGHSPASLPFSVAAHEAAHQWWGHLVTTGDGPGDGWLVEGMAHYCTLLLHRAVHGDEARIAFARQLERIYLDRRRRGERPLLRALEGDPAEEVVLSQRGAWMLWMLQERVGREVMLATLGDLAARHAASRRHLEPETLLAALRSRAPDPVAFDTFVDQWLDGTALPEYRLSDPALTRTADGWRAAVTVTNSGTGTAAVEVVAVPGRRDGGEPDGRRKGAGRAEVHRIELGPEASARLTWDLTFRPERLVVDPDARVLQLNRDHAVVDLVEATAPGTLAGVREGSNRAR